MNRQRIGFFIAQLRREMNITQSELAKKLFVDRATVSKWEHGNYLPSVEVLLRMSNIFNVTINEILLGERYGYEEENFYSNISN